MAEEITEATEGAEDAPKKKSGSKKTIIVIASVALLEAAGFFAFIKFFYATPEPSFGAETEHVVEEEQAAPATKTAEVDLLKRFKVPNSAKGLTYLYDFDIAILVPVDKKEAATLIVEEHKSQVSDRVAQLVRAANTRVLDEVDFKSLRMQIHETLAQVFQDDTLVLEVLIPRCVPIRTD